LKNLKVVGVLLVFSFVAACATVDTEDVLPRSGAHYKIGVAYLNENKVQQAFVEFQKAIELNPNDKEVLNAIGIIYLQHFDETQKAIEFFERAVKVDPLYSEAYNNLGFAHYKLGNFETAISFYKKSLSNLIYSTPEKSFINLGNAYYRMGKYDLALYSYKEAIKRAPNLSLAYLRLALCYNAMGKYGDASAAMTQAIVIDPDYKGNKEKLIEDFSTRRFRVSGYEEQDIKDYLEILKY